MVGNTTVARCSSCGQINRVDIEKLEEGLQPKCGNCRTPLVIGDNGPVAVSDSTFSEIVERSDLPVLVDFWAPWCGPCHALSPTIEQMASDLSGRALIAKLNTDENPRTASRFRIQGIPTLILFQNGREVDRMVGVQPKRAIADRIEAILKRLNR